METAMKVTVAKFGGTSLADPGQFKKVIAIIKSDPARQYIVVSAPGKRDSNDRKVTDLLYQVHMLSAEGLPYLTVLNKIEERYQEIVDGIGLKFDVKAEIASINRAIIRNASRDYVASRGEYLNGMILAGALGYEFLDPVKCIFLDHFGRYKEQDDRLKKYLEKGNVVIPGFYGQGPDDVKTFSRGGSDITGAIVASVVRASLYENWTDVPGLLTADPRIVARPRVIDTVTYRELRELSYMGADVFHEEAMFPVHKAKIPTNILNTNDPMAPGTHIVVDADHIKPLGPVTGVAGRKGFTVITLEKGLMNSQKGFALKVLTALERNEVSLEHMPGGIDTLSVVIDDRELEGKLDAVVAWIKRDCEPDTIEAWVGMAMVAVVGRGMVHSPGIAARVCGALAKESISIRMINQGSSELNIIVGVENSDYKNAIRAIHAEFFG